MFLKRAVGWLCVACLASALFFAGYYTYVTVTPFFRGAELYRYYVDGERLSWQLSEQGLNASDSALLRGYYDTQSYAEAYNGWEAVPQLVDAWHTPKVSKPEPYILWMAVADAGGRVVASYPESVAARFGSVTNRSTEGWYGAMADGQRLPGRVNVYILRDPDGTEIGSLAVATRPYSVIAVMPPGAEVPTHISPVDMVWVAVFCLLGFVLLLPVWVVLDADWRGMRSFSWGALTLLTGPIGFAAYLIARLAPPKPCPNCGERVQSKYNRCPACGVSLSGKCGVCGTQMKAGWQYCPKCNAVPGQSFEEIRAVEAPVPTCEAQEAGLLTVMVWDADGVPVANAQVRIQGQSVVDGLTNAQGRFDARKLTEGAYIVSASLPGCDSAQAGVQVAEGGCSAVELVLKALPGSIAGRVLDRSTLQPVPGAKVYIDSARADRSDTADEDGAFRLEDLPAGPYVVCVDVAGFDSQTKLAEVGRGGNVALSFALEPALEQEGANVAE